MAWSELDKQPEKSPEQEKHAEKLRALGAAAKATIGSGQHPQLKEFLLSKAHAVSFRPGMDPAEVAFMEGQRSLALQLLKIAGELQ